MTGPDDTTSATALPAATLVPAAGDWLMTLPAVTVALFAVVVAPTLSPAFAIAVFAAACGCPTTLGTATFAGPSDTISATGLPGATLVPPAGVWPITLPEAMLVLLAVVTPP